MPDGVERRNLGPSTRGRDTRSLQTQLPDRAALKVAEEGRDVDLERESESDEDVEARPLLAPFEIADVVQRHTGGFGELLLRPVMLEAETAKRLAEEHGLRSLPTIVCARCHFLPLTFHTIVGMFVTHDRG